MGRLTAIDVFAGAGGLSVGLEQAGFDVVGAVELNPAAAETYRRNHPRTTMFCEDVRNIAGSALKALSPDGHVDLVVGCPPCQGFSTLTNKYKRNDPRNELALEMLRLVLEIAPTAVMLENVPGLGAKGKDVFGKFVSGLSGAGYRPNYAVLQVADYGVPQMRRRLVLLAGKNFEVPLPEGEYSVSGSGGKKVWKTLRSAIGEGASPVTLSESAALGGPRAVNWNVVRNISATNKARLQASKPGATRYSLSDELRPPCHRNARSGFGNVYGRMSWDKPSPTVTSGCTTPSKGRFGHPDELRTISVREAATLQTFPADYDFVSPSIDQVCVMIGNALPCEFARILSQSCSQAIRAHRSTNAEKV